MGFEAPEKKEKTVSLPEENTLPLKIKDSERLVDGGEATVWKTLTQDKDKLNKMIALKQVHREIFASEEEMRESQEFYKFLKNFPEFGKFVPDTLYFKARLTPDSNPQAFCLQSFIEGERIDRLKDEEIYKNPVVISQLLELSDAAIKILQETRKNKIHKPDFMWTPETGNFRALLGAWLSDPRYSSNIVIAKKPDKEGRQVFFVDTGVNASERANKINELHGRYVVSPLGETQFKRWQEKMKNILEEKFREIKPNLEKDSQEKESQQNVNGLLGDQEEPEPIVKKLEYFLKAQFGKIEIVGQENLDLIPRDRRVVFTPTHLSNFDVPLSIYSIGQYFRLMIGEASTHAKISDNAMGFIGNRLAGKENFLPITHKKNSKGTERGSFDPENLEVLKTAFEENKALMVSAYYNGEEKSNLPSKGGYGAIYLAEIANALIVPVAVDIKSKEKTEMQKNLVKAIFSFPDVQVNIGQPIELTKIEGIERLREISEKRKTDKLSKEEIKEFHHLSQRLREQSDLLMKKLAELLPEKKRGKWANEEY